MSSKDQLVDLLNAALGWELRAQNMYAHYAAYVTGFARLHLRPYFAAEATESMAHAAQVRDAIMKLGGQAVTAPAGVEILHTDDYRKMLEEALATEIRAGALYREVRSELDPDDELADVILQIMFAEERAVDELKKLL